MIPWWVKICAKLLLARLPVPYAFWKRIGIFRHGTMDRADYAYQVFFEHISRAGVANTLQGKNILELGPGDSIATAIVAAAFGATSVLVDSDDYAVEDLELYRQIANSLRNLGLNTPNMNDARSRDEVLKKCRSKYFSEGLNSLKTISSHSIDFLFSQAVLEHIRKNEFFETMRECRRVLRSGGFASHRVDLRDHLDGNLNNLRFPEAVWESELFVRSGFYTNRLRFSEIVSIMEQVGFRIIKISVYRWGSAPIKRNSLSRDFLLTTDEDLLVNGFDVLLMPI
jgi:hypothetical protein